METLKVTVTIEDEFGVVFTEKVDIPREKLIPPGKATAGIETVAVALLEVAKGV